MVSTGVGIAARGSGTPSGRGRRALLLGLTALTVACLGAASVGLARPFALIPRDAVVVYVGTCRFSLRTLENLSAVPAGAPGLPLFVPVPVEEAAAGRVCPVAIERLRSASFLARNVARLLPDAVACRQLLTDAAAFHRAHFTSLPAFSVGTIAVPGRAERAIFATIGVDLRHDDQGGAVFAPAPPAPVQLSPAAKAREEKQEEEWRRRAINIPVGL